MRSVLTLIAIAVVGGLLSLTACNSAEQKKLTSTAPVSGQPTAAPAFADGVRRITPTELRDLLAKNEAVVIDVRKEEDYNTAHIRGAKLIPEADVAKRSNELPKDKLIVTYCA